MNQAHPAFLEEDAILLSARDARGVVTLTLNRPNAFNALSEAMLPMLPFMPVMLAV